MKILNIGCGQAPIVGAINIDNSFSVFLSKHNFFYFLLKKTGFLSKENINMVLFCKNNKIKFGNATKLKFAENSVDVIYTSHVLEHITRDEVMSFVKQAHLILKPGGVLRIVLPDMNILINDYIKDGNMDRLIDRSLLVINYGNSFKAKLKYLLFGWRGHKWMYDEKSVFSLLSNSGFSLVKILQPGETNIKESTNINLYEKVGESMYIECIK